MPIHRFSDPAVKAVFDAYPQELRSALRELRALILDVAEAMPSVGKVDETLKWGQPAYRPAKPRTGTTVRIGPVRGSDEDYALFVPCQTTLIADFRELYKGRLRYLGDRGVIFTLGDAVPVEALKHCVALALTYHVRPQ
ncbi:MAG: DUF1801 domain-containing protein [Alphaproteobacteria bacterium]|nr:DUF1801 domain-containing protein [Alphaproteobacteria bacterium]